MGILDDAIKEHLELKRQHGAGESELKQLEDEAFGASERPGDEQPASDALSEAPTAFMTQPDLGEADGEEASSRRRPAPQIADLQEGPEHEAASSESDAPAEEATAMEHEAVAEPEAEAEVEAEAEAVVDAEADNEPGVAAGHSTEERQAIAEHPTEMYDVEEELAAKEREAPSEEELVEQEVSEPRLAPVDPLASVEEVPGAEVEVTDARQEDDTDLDDEFWDEKRLSDELDQALEAPSEPDEPEPEPEPDDPEPEPDDPDEPQLAPAPEPVADEEPAARGAGETEEWQGQPRERDEDVLEETPDFLEEAPEDDQLWFEQKPPKDFDFDN
jgi:hypothetical protein